MKDIGYTTLSTVLETWDQARFSSKDFESEFGMVALERCVHPSCTWKPLDFYRFTHLLLCALLL